MSGSTFGARIHTLTNVTDVDAGLFDGVFWLSESPVSNADPWKPGFIPENSLGDTDESIDLRPGGNIAHAGGFKVSIANANPKISKVLDDAGIALTGKRVEIVEIDAGSLLEYVRAVGVCIEISWHETELILSCEDPGNSMDACISPALSAEDYPGLLDSVKGRIAPVCFGRIDKAKAIAITNTEVALSNDDIVAPGSYDPVATVFPISSPDSATPTLTYKIDIGLLKDAVGVVAAAVAAFKPSTVIGKMLKSVKGKSSGEYRKIVNAQFDGYDLTVTVDALFPESLRGELAAINIDPGTQTWVSIVDADKTFLFDTAACAGVEDANGALSTTDHALFAFSDNARSDADTNMIISEERKFRPIPNFMSADIDAKHSSIAIMPSRVDANIDTVKFVVINPPKAVRVIGDDAAPPSQFGNVTLQPWAENESDKDPGRFKRLASGLYARSHLQTGQYEPVPSDYTLDIATNPPANALDKNYATCARSILTSLGNKAQNSQLALGYTFEPPDVEDGLEFDKCYLLIRARATDNFAGSMLTTRCAYRSWNGYATYILPKTVGDKHFQSGQSESKSMLDDYDGGHKGNQYFYTKSDTTLAHLSLITGYQNFELPGITNVEQFRNISDVCYWNKFYISWYDAARYIQSELYEVAFAFMTSGSIKDAVFAGFQGRTFEGSLISDPVTLLRYLDHYKNTSYIMNRRIPYGLVKSPDAQVNNSAAEGGYNYSRLAQPKAQTIAFETGI